MDPKRYASLAGIVPDHIHADEPDDFGERMDREKHVEVMIRHAFTKLGLKINDRSFSISYEDDTREAEVLLDDVVHGFPLEALARLQQTGLADKYLVAADDYCLRISFTVSEALDYAKAA